MSIVVRLEEIELKPEQELAALLADASGDGAVVNFVGVARPCSKDGQEIGSLTLERHPILTLQSLQEIAIAVGQRFDVSHVRVVHRCGDLAPGEPIVFAGAAAAHRRPAFEAADCLMDCLKTEAVFWKREIGETGSEWIEPTDADYADRDRWG